MRPRTGNVLCREDIRLPHFTAACYLVGRRAGFHKQKKSADCDCGLARSSCNTAECGVQLGLRPRRAGARLLSGGAVPGPLPRRPARIASCAPPRPSRSARLHAGACRAAGALAPVGNWLASPLSLFCSGGLTTNQNIACVFGVRVSQIGVASWAVRLLNEWALPAEVRIPRVFEWQGLL